MKKTFLFGLLALISVVSAQAQNTVEPKGYTIRGTVDNLEDGETVMLLADSEAMKFDTCTVRNGKFILSGYVEHPFLTMLMIGNEDNPAAIPVDLFLDNDDIAVTGDFRDKNSIMLTGSGLTDKYRNFLATNREFAMRAAKNPEQAREINMESLNYNIETIKENIGNGFGLLLLNGLCYAEINEQVVHLASLIPEDAKDHFYAKTILSKVENTAPQLEVGSEYYPVELPDVNDKLVSVGEILKTDKLVLIDFWASWCEPCLKKIPELKSIYNKYKERGFEIYAISTDTDRDSWVGAVNKFELPWVNVSSLEGDSCPHYIRYGVHQRGIPYYILILNEEIVRFAGTDVKDRIHVSYKQIVLYIGSDLGEVRKILSERLD